MIGPDWAERYTYDPAGNLSAGSWPAPPPGPPGAELAGLWGAFSVVRTENAPHSPAGLGPGAQGPRQVTGTLITRAGNVRYRHDRQGRVIQRQVARISRKPDTWHYHWDADSRMTGVTTPDGTTWRYRYDPFGRRIAKQRLTGDGSIAEQTDFSWDGPVLAEQATPAAQPGQYEVVTWDYRPGSFTALTQAEHRSADDLGDLGDASQEQIDQRFYAIIADLVGTPAELVAPDGTLAGCQQHTLWGTTVWRPGGAETPLRFPGQYADPETGLHYNQHRYYDPVIASYLTPDPLGLAAAPNPHAYVPNPQVLADPLGLTPYEPTEQGGSNVLLDTGSVIKNRSARGLLNPGDVPVVNETTARELAEVGARKGFVGTLPDGVSVIPDDTSMVLRGQVMQQLRMFNAATQGIENDAAVGATALGMGIPLITTDYALANAVTKLGGMLRYLEP